MPINQHILDELTLQASLRLHMNLDPWSPLADMTHWHSLKPLGPEDVLA